MEKFGSRIRLNFRSKQPLFEQLADFIRGDIQSGQYQPDDLLPPVRQMAEQLKINFNTVARAYRVLDFEGWISTQQGRGTYILAHAEAPASTSDEATAEGFPHRPIDLLAERIRSMVEKSGLSMEEVLALLSSNVISQEEKEEPASQRPVHQIKRVQLHFSRIRTGSKFLYPDRSNQRRNHKIRHNQHSSSKRPLS